MAHDPGGKTRRPLGPGVQGLAVFSGPDDCYRLTLTRSWGASDAPYALWVGCNPSTAEADVDDPTVALEQGHTRALSLTRYVKVNLSPYRATDPGQLRYATVPLVPEGHDLALAHLAVEAEWVIVACGVPPPPLAVEGRDLLGTLSLLAPLWCLGTTAEGWPRHPLYIPAEAPLARWHSHQEGLGPTLRFYAPDEAPAGGWRVADAFASRAHRPRRLRDLTFYQVVAVGPGGTPVSVPAGHLADRYRAEVDLWAARVMR